MHASIFRAAILACAFASLTSPTRAVTYTATLLHPDDFLDTNGAGVSNATQVGSGMTADFDGPHALLWTGSAASFVDLHPATGFNSSYAIGARSTQQVGYGSGPATGGNVHALLWSGTAASAVDLNPAGIDTSYAHGISGNFQVGYGFNTIDFNSHALLWNGIAASKVDLNPAGYTESFGNSIYNGLQVGYGYGPATGDNNHALLWNGSAAGKVDLNPTGFTESYANAVLFPPGFSMGTVVGSGAGSATNSETHALLWTGTAASKVDLHPTAGYSFSEALGISAAGQVGDGYGGSTFGAYHALYWNGTAASAIDLHTNLLADTGYAFVSSQAFAIADNGNIVGTATDDGLHTYAILWTPNSSESGVAGDYNNNGKVDAGDYIAWRKGNATLHNEVSTIGSNTPADYTEWRARFGKPPGSGSGLSGAPVPEPTACALVAYCICMMLISRPRACHC
jgi:probable HAF family extracellular repeat protein